MVTALPRECRLNVQQPFQLAPEKHELYWARAKGPHRLAGRASHNQAVVLTGGKWYQ